jgi:hypothetical protein
MLQWCSLFGPIVRRFLHISTRLPAFAKQRDSLARALENTLSELIQVAVA